MARTIENEIDVLKEKITRLSARVEEVVRMAVQAVEKRDPKLAQEVIDSDEEVDRIEVEVEEECLKILATQQPVAIDLRYVVGVLKLNNDLERIGDLGVNIAEKALFLSQSKDVVAPFDFKEMSQKTLKMLKDSLDALLRKDVVLANKVRAADDEVDELNRKMYDLVFKSIQANPSSVQAFVNYLSVSRHLERIADYTTNIAEDVIYMVEGDIVRHRH